MKSFNSGSISEEVNYTKYSRIIAFCLLIGISLLVCCPVILFISKYYSDYIIVLYGYWKQNVVENHSLELVFKILKVISPLVFVWLIIIWFDFFNDRKRWTVQLINKIAESILSSFYGNKLFFYSLKKETRFIVVVYFTILFFAILYFICVIPLQYDEWYSYLFFTRPGFWTTLSNYTSTNNHIFSNLIVCIFAKLPFDPEVTMRLPNIFITLLCMWYFLKLCKYCFSDTISIILLVFVIIPYPFVMYAFAARGYMCLNLFCVLIMYSSFQLSENYYNKKYRIIFVLSLVLGTLSMPTFIYAIFPVCIVLGFYVIKQKQLNNLFLLLKDGLAAIVLIFLSYSFVLIFNDLNYIMGLNGFSTKFSLSDPGTFEKIIAHLKSVYQYLFSQEKLLPLSCVLIVLSTILYLFKNKNKSFFICILSAAMVFSPVLILILQRVIPFERNWLFLIFPSALCLGFIIHNIVSLIKFQFLIQFSNKYRIALQALVLSIGLFSFSRFTARHMHFASMDFEISEMRQKYLDAAIRNVHEISSTKKSYEYHPADMIWFLTQYADPKRPVKINELTKIENQDILIIDKTEVDHYKDSLNNYKLLKEIGYQINIYGRIGLF